MALIHHWAKYGKK